MYDFSPTTGFWDFESASKKNVLTSRHAPIILDAIKDKDTHIDKIGVGVFLLYSEDESLLVKSPDPVIMSTLILCESLFNLN